ncbi:MAG: glycosyltransferase family 1 protein [Coriobacteriaceae bacterium]|nr:glycosyltransferase family 1 protein [Coriobacteriaceae bacterium]
MLRSPPMSMGAIVTMFQLEERAMAEKPIRVLHVIGGMNRGGAETMVMNLFRAVDRSRIQFDFLVHAEGPCDYDEEIEELGGRIYRISRFTGRNIIEYRRACRVFFTAHDEIRIVHGHIGSSAALYLSEAKRAGKFTIAHSHAQNYPISLEEIAFRIVSFPTRHIADYLIACSEQAGIDRFGRSFQREGHRSILKNGVDLAQFRFSLENRKEIRSELSIPMGARVFGHVGRFDPIKNHVFLLDVFKKILSADPESHLILVGREDDEGSVRKRCELLGMEERVHIIGLRDDTHRVLSALDVFLFPSLKEGLPMACVEAQASGLPCVISTGVPKLAIITDTAYHLALSEGADAWASTASAIARKCGASYLAERGPRSEQVRSAGFDVGESARWLQDFYQARYSEMMGGRDE